MSPGDISEGGFSKYLNNKDSLRIKSELSNDDEDNSLNVETD